MPVVHVYALDSAQSVRVAKAGIIIIRPAPILIRIQSAARSKKTIPRRPVLIQHFNYRTRNISGGGFFNPGPIESPP